MGYVFWIALSLGLIQAFVIYSEHRKTKFHLMLVDRLFAPGSNIDPMASYDKFFESRFWDHNFEKMLVSKN